MKHYRWHINCGMGVLLAGSWTLPAAAVEVLPELAHSGADPASLLSNISPNGMEAIAPTITAVKAWPERLPPPSVTLLESAVASLTVTPGRAADDEMTRVAPPDPAILERAISVPEFSDFVTAPSLGDRLKPEFVPARPLETLANDVSQGESQSVLIAETEAMGQNGDVLIVPVESEAPPLAEDASQLEQGATVLDNGGELPAGDLLESVDGLEDSGIAGEGAITEESGPATNSDGASVGQQREAGQTLEQLLDNGEAEAGDAAVDADALEADAFDSEKFDSEDFEAEDFEFEEDLDSNPSEATVEGESEGDPDLGILRLRERPLSKQKSPLEIPVFLVGNVGYISNDNTLAGVDPVNDRLFRSGLSLIASPRLSKRTALIASVQGNLNRYDELSRLDYNEVRLQTSLRHVFTRKVYGDLGWTHRQLFLQEDGDRFLYEHAAFASLTRRDALTQKMSLTSFYNLRAGFADPETSSRLRNTVGVSLRHDVTPALQVSLTGRATLTNFTQQSRQDFYTQALAQLSYKISKNVRLSAFGSLTRGNSSSRRVDFDNSTVGVSLSGSVKLF